MVQTLQKLTHLLNPQLWTLAYLWNKIIEAIYMYLACQIAIGRPFTTVLELITDLCISVS
jgi:hypothetical protein